MKHDYFELPALSSLYLEDSWVYNIAASPGSIVFTMDFVLTPENGSYVPPLGREQYCYRQGTLSFTHVTESSWSDQGAPASKDAAGVIDYGNIDEFQWENFTYSLVGSWGHLEIVAENVAVRFEKAKKP